MRTDIIQKMTVMRNDQHRAEIIREEILKPADRVDIEVVRRLIEQDDIRIAEERLREQNLDLLVAVQLGHLRIEQLLAET